MLKFLEKELPKLWTDELYSKEFRESNSPYKDFQHGYLHVMKAAGHLLEMIEEADHCRLTEDVVSYFPKDDVSNYVADLIICAVRLALKNPSGVVDLEKAVIDRIYNKMGVRLKYGQEI
jgi:hypothetical protein